MGYLVYDVYKKSCHVSFWMGVCALMLVQCGQGESVPDASGSFEAEEIIVAAETPGVLDTQIETQEGELQRFLALREANAAPQKQVDDLAHQLELLRSQRKASFTQLDLQSRSLYAELDALRAQMGALRDKLKNVRS